MYGSWLHRALSSGKHVICTLWWPSSLQKGAWDLATELNFISHVDRQRGTRVTRALNELKRNSVSPRGANSCCTSAASNIRPNQFYGLRSNLFSETKFATQRDWIKDRQDPLKRITQANQTKIIVTDWKQITKLYFYQIENLIKKDMLWFVYRDKNFSRKI